MKAMVEILDETENNLIAIKAENTITKEDYEALLPLLEDKIYANGTIRLYMEIQDLEGIELKALWEDLKFDSKHADDFSKMAVVGNKKWEEWLIKASKPMTSGEIKFFELSDKEKAIEWV